MAGNEAYASARAGSRWRLAAWIAAAVSALFVVWVNLAVGAVGTEDDPSNLMYFAALAAGFSAALIARFRASGMARAMVVTAIALALAAGYALLTGKQSAVSPATEILGVTAIFIVLFLGSAGLFWKAAREEHHA